MGARRRALICIWRAPSGDVRWGAPSSWCGGGGGGTASRPQPPTAAPRRGYPLSLRPPLRASPQGAPEPRAAPSPPGAPLTETTVGQYLGVLGRPRLPAPLPQPCERHVNTPFPRVFVLEISPEPPQTSLPGVKTAPRPRHAEEAGRSRFSLSPRGVKSTCD